MQIFSSQGNLQDDQYNKTADSLHSELFTHAHKHWCFFQLMIYTKINIGYDSIYRSNYIQRRHAMCAEEMLRNAYKCKEREL